MIAFRPEEVLIDGDLTNDIIIGISITNEMKSDDYAVLGI
jgi:hypothetical protein